MPAYLFDADRLPAGFTLPDSFVRLMSIEPLPWPKPWWFLTEDPADAREWLALVREYYPARSLVPFAKYGAYDDIACFDGSDTSGDPKVFYVHFAASPGWEDRGSVPNFDAWLEAAWKDSGEWREDQERG